MPLDVIPLMLLINELVVSFYWKHLKLLREILFECCLFLINDCIELSPA